MINKNYFNNLKDLLRKNSIYHKYLRLKDKFSTELQEIEIALTYDCNLDCSYCYVKGLNKNIKLISLKQFNIIINWQFNHD